MARPKIDGNINEAIALIPTLGEREEVFRVIATCKSLNLSLLVVHQGWTNLERLTAEEDEQTILLHIENIEGVSKARNAGLQYLERHTQYRYVFTINDCTLPNIEFIEQGIQIMSCQPDVKAVCGKYQFLSGLDSVQVQGEVSNWNCMRILESVMLLKLDGIYPLGGYKEGLGTGSKSLSQSGEGADLLLRIKKNGGRILALNTIAARDLRDRPTHSFIKNFGYGIGFSSVAKLHKMRKRAFIRSFTPIIRYIFRKKLPDSPENFASTFAVSCGRLMGILTPKRFLIASGNKK